MPDELAWVLLYFIGVFISFDIKKRKSIPLVQTKNGFVRVDMVSDYANNLYEKLLTEKDTTYAYVEGIKNI